MTTTRRLAAGGLLAAGALLLMAASIALASDESPSPGVVPGGKPEATPTPAVEPATAPLAPLAAATPTPAAKPAAKPAATPKPAKVPDADEGPIQTLTGTLGTRTDADGDVEYVLDGVELSVGPPWYWGKNNPLEKYYVNKTTVTVTGRMETDPPSTKANGKANDADGPEFEVYTVNGSKVRAEGKPPWAGGPKAVGERHPGYAGWSNGKADKADKAKAAPKP